LDEPLNEPDARLRDELIKPRGAYVMGRNMFGPARGEWDEDWRGWWDDEPPYHAPMFVLTHHAHDPIEMHGGPTFYFVTAGFDAALEHAKRPQGTKRSPSPVAPRPRDRRSPRG
jgi:dihydrofolate reductase